MTLEFRYDHIDGYNIYFSVYTDNKFIGAVRLDFYPDLSFIEQQENGQNILEENR